MIGTLALTTVLFMVILTLWDFRKFFKASWKMGGPFAWPIAGSAWTLRNINDSMDALDAMARKYASPFRIWLGPRFMVYTCDASQIERILNAPECTDKGFMYTFLESVVGMGLFSSKGNIWRVHRRLLNPSFSHSILKSFYPIFNKNVRVLVKATESYVGKGPFNLYDLVDACTLDMICETTMGTVIDTTSETTNVFKHNVNFLMNVIAQRMCRFWLHFDVIFRNSPLGRAAAAARRNGFEYTNGIVNLKIDEYKKDYDDEMNGNKTADKCETLPEDSYDKIIRGNIFIHQAAKLMVKDKLFTHEDVLAECRTIIVAGYETSALVTSYTILLLAMHPEIQDLVFEELHSMFPCVDSEVSAEDVANMPYTERVLKESMRLFPAVPLISRTVTQEMQLNDLKLPSGTEIAIGIMMMHRNKRIWGEDADEFNPDHFLSENIKDNHPYAYLPFGGGPRNCIGMRYGYIVLKIMMSHLLRKYRFTTSLKMSDIKCCMNITLKLQNKHMVEVHERNSY